MNQLRGDLDWIVMKCLEKDRSRRYDTANGLATDLKRHLEFRRKVLGAEHSDTLDALLNLANSYFDADHKDEALKLREQLVPLYRKVLGPENPTTLSALHNLAISIPTGYSA